MSVTGYGRAKLPKQFRRLAQHYVRNFVWFALSAITVWMLYSNYVQINAADDVLRAYGFGSARILL